MSSMMLLEAGELVEEGIPMQLDSAVSDLDNGVHTASSWYMTFSALLPALTVQVLFLAPLPAVREMVRTRSTGGLTSALTYTAMACNGMVYLTYGYLKNDWSIMVANIPALILGHYYLHIYGSCTTQSTAKDYTAFAGCVCLCFILATQFSNDRAELAVGLFGGAVSVAMVGGPIGQISKVVRDRSTASLDMKFSVATLVNALAWINYGALQEDVLIWGPNIIGLVSGSVQLMLFHLYRREHRYDLFRREEPTFNIMK